MSDRQFITFSYMPGQRPELHARIEALGKGIRSAAICDALDPAVSPIEKDERLDRVLALVEAMALQSDRVEAALMNMARKLAEGTPMQTVVEQIQNDQDLPDDVIGNLVDLGG